MSGLYRRSRQGASLFLVLVSLTVLAAVGGTTALVIKNRLEPGPVAGEQLFGGFVSRFHRLASVQSAARWSDPNFHASSLTGSFALTEGSTQTVNVAFEGCVVPSGVLSYNTLSTSDVTALDAEMTAETPAQSITDGNGQTGGVLLNEIYHRRFDGQTRLFRYRLTDPSGTRSALSYIPGSELPGGTQCL